MSCFPFLCSGAVVVCGRFCVVILWRIGIKTNPLEFAASEGRLKAVLRFRRPF
ncbi:hypothetical protein [Neisseria sicca]|uniref:hypothetical protein n=1 Tax=Neisseria sicca TaxID=490 RepID=UPI00131E636B|nr:hypothetical protein [Neisseria sicca]